MTKTYFLLLQLSIRPVPAQVILLWKGPPKLCIECHLVPLWAFLPKSPGQETCPIISLLLKRRSLKVNWNAETRFDPYHKILKPWKQFRRNFWEIRFRFRDMGRWNLRFYWFRRFPRKDREMCGRYRESHAKELWRQRRSFSSLQVRFINDSELRSVLVAR